MKSHANGGSEGRVAAIVTKAEPIEVLERLYDFRQPAEIRDFLARHSGLLDILIEVSSKIPEYMPTSRRILLEVLRDPEDDEADGQLFAVIPTELEPEDVLPRLDRMRRDWWIATARGLGGRINIDVEYV